MKTLSKSNLFTTLLLMIFSFGIIVFWGCEKQEVTSEADIIVETEEFQEYLSAYINMVNELQNVKNGPRKKIGEKNGHILYQHQTIDASIYKKTIKARNKLISKYPEYKNILRDC